MKLSISNIAWLEKDDEYIYDYMSKQSFKGLEIAPTRLFGSDVYNRIDTSKNYVKKLGDIGLEISSMQSIWYGKDQNLFGSLEDTNYLIFYTKKAIKFASELNCKNLVLGSPRNRILSSVRDYIKAVTIFEELGEYAKENNTVLSIEPSPTIYGTNFINTTDEAIKLVKEVNSTGFKVNFDLGTVIQNQEKLQISDYINYINHVHISEPYLLPIKTNELHSALFYHLKESGYSKYVSIEMKRTDNLSDVTSAIDYIKEVFSDI